LLAALLAATIRLLESQWESEMEVHAEKRVRAGADRVFDVFADVTKIEERIPGITSVELLS
jgi:hypothetical protein